MLTVATFVDSVPDSFNLVELHSPIPRSPLRCKDKFCFADQLTVELSLNLSIFFCFLDRKLVKPPLEVSDEHSERFVHND